MQPAGQRLQQALRPEHQHRGVVGALRQLERGVKGGRRLEPALRIGRFAVGARQRLLQRDAAALGQLGARQRAHVAETAAADAVQQLGEPMQRGGARRGGAHVAAGHAG